MKIVELLLQEKGMMKLTEMLWNLVRRQQAAFQQVLCSDMLGESHAAISRFHEAKPDNMDREGTSTLTLEQRLHALQRA